MAHENKVLQSIGLPGESRCVDVFQRPDSTFGFEEFRRDIEDNQGWFAVGFYGSQEFSSEEEALAQALLKVVWLKDAIAKG